MPATDSVRLLLVDEHAMFREGIAKVLEAGRGLTIVGHCGSVAEALALVEDRNPDVVLLEVAFGEDRALDFVVRAKKSGFEGKILILTAGISETEAVDLVKAGSAGILHKVHSGEKLVSTVRQVASGEVYLEQKYLTALFQSVDRTRASGAGFTERDRSILRFVCQGLTNKDIAAHLDLSESSIKASLRHLFDKVGVRTRAQLVKIALEKYPDQLYQR